MGSQSVVVVVRIPAAITHIKRIKRTIISLRALTSELREIDFSKVDAMACLIGIEGAGLAKCLRLDPVRPIVNFNMVAPRFTDKSAVLPGLDSRPNIAERTPCVSRRRRIFN